MDILYAPSRALYAKNSQAQTKKEHASKDECVFCQKLSQADDETNLILRRFKSCMVVMSRYPYNPGHVMILPLEHVNHLDKVAKSTRAEIMELITASCAILEKELNAQGINSGVNLGKAAGAGIPSHIHWHVVPRWLGDTNFMPVIGKIKVFSMDLQALYRQLKPHFDALMNEF